MNNSAELIDVYNSEIVKAIYKGPSLFDTFIGKEEGVAAYAVVSLF